MFLHRVASYFRRRITPLRCVVVFVIVLAFALGVTLPTVNVVRRNNLAATAEINDAIAQELVGLVDAQFAEMLTAVDLLIGFAASAAPLQAPAYFTDPPNATARLEVAMQSGTPGALSADAYERVRTIVSTMFLGYRNAIVQPGLVNAFIDPDHLSDAAWPYENNTDIRREFEFMVNTTQNVVRGPVLASEDGAPVLSLRAPVFTDPAAVVNVSIVDPTTGRSPNWNLLWGAVTLVMTLPDLVAQSNFSSVAGDSADYLFEALASTDRVTPTPYFVLANSTEPLQFQGDDTSFACAETEGFRGFCFRVRQKTVDSHSALVVLGVSTIIVVAAVIGLFLLALLLLRCLSGPVTNPLRDAPTLTPFYAVCVDMVDANRLWSEAPFIMDDVTSTFTTTLQKLTARHSVFPAIRIGNTVVVISRSKSGILHFARGIMQWATSFQWPPQVSLYCPTGRIRFGCVLHRCEKAEIIIDYTNETFEVKGDDVQELLLLRRALAPQHIIATGEFLGPNGCASPRRTKPNTSSSMRVFGSNGDDDNDSADVGHVHALGLCDLPLPHGRCPVTTVRGYLLHSAATENHASLAHAVDALPDAVWAEWHAEEAHLEAQNLFADSMEAAGFSAIARFSSTGGMGAIGSPFFIQGIRDVLEKVLRRNAEAHHDLPGSAVNSTETDRLAHVLVPMISSRAIVSASFASRSVMGPMMSPDTPFRPMDATTSGLIASPFYNSSISRIRATLSIATYFLLALDTVFATIDSDSRTTIVAKICAAVGTRVEDHTYGLAARCAQLTGHPLLAGQFSGSLHSRPEFAASGHG
jgi:hypothetical protein